MDLTPGEVLSEAGRWVNAVKAVVIIDVEREGKRFYHSRASVLIKRPRMVHMRLYNLGMLMVDMVVKGDNIHLLHGRINEELRPFIGELYYAVFWWDGIRGGEMVTEDGMYVIKGREREVYIDRNTLLPIRQSLRIEGRSFYIIYRRPKRVGDFWYPSFMEMRTDGYKFLVVVKLLKPNPLLNGDESSTF